jgi:hypothetical protein
MAIATGAAGQNPAAVSVAQYRENGTKELDAERSLRPRSNVRHISDFVEERTADLYLRGCGTRRLHTTMLVLQSSQV